MKTMLVLSALLVASMALVPGVAAEDSADLGTESEIATICVEVTPFRYWVGPVAIENDKTIRVICVL